MSLFSPRRGLKVRALPRYPIRIVGADGISAARASGVLTIALDFSELSLVDLGTIVQADTLVLLELDDGTFRKVSLAQLIAEIEDDHTHTLSDITDAGALAALDTVTLSLVTDAGALASLDTVGTTQIDNAAVTSAKLANMAEATVKGRASGAGTGAPTDLSSAQLSTILGLGSAALLAGASGFYTPTFANATNVGTITFSESQYIRIGSNVRVDGGFSLDPTAAAATSFEVTLPIASDFTVADQCNGLWGSSIATNSGLVAASVTNNRAAFSIVTTHTDAQFYRFGFTYRVL